MLTVLLGLSGALAYGFADFAGGIASRKRRPIVVTTLTAAIGVVPLLIGLLVIGGRFSGDALLWGAVAGISGSMGVLLLYSVLAIGPMSILSPVTSVFAAILPVITALVLGARLSAIATVALVVAVVAVVLVSAVRNTSGARLSVRGLLMAAVAGCGFGGLVLAWNMTSPTDGVAPLVIARVTQVILMGTALLVTTRRLRPEPGATDAPTVDRRFWFIVAACGVLDATANIFIHAAVHSSTDPATLPIVSVLNALYPVGTIVLAAVVLRERLNLAQIAGISLGIAASVVLALN